MLVVYINISERLFMVCGTEPLSSIFQITRCHAAQLLVFRNATVRLGGGFILQESYGVVQCSLKLQCSAARLKPVNTAPHCTCTVVNYLTS